jgi:hypothetical protein
MMQSRRDMNAEKQQMYQDALRRAFGRNPTLPALRVEGSGCRALGIEMCQDALMLCVAPSAATLRCLSLKLRVEGLEMSFDTLRRAFGRNPTLPVHYACFSYNTRRNLCLHYVTETVAPSSKERK